MLDLRSLFNLSYGMYIVSSKNGEDCKGCIVNTVFQITPQPPMIAVSINKENCTHEVISRSKVFSVSVLHEQTPMDFIGKFGFKSCRDIDKFHQVDYKFGVTGAPIVLDHAMGYIEAEVCNAIDVETHTLFIGKVMAGQTISENHVPMTYNYYRDIKGGRTPRTAATYMAKEMAVKESAAFKNTGVDKMQKFRCSLCSYVYDPAIGDPTNGVKAVTAFADLPGDWTCPDCGASKTDFEPV